MTKSSASILSQSLTGIERVMWAVSAALCVGTAYFFGFQERLGMGLGTVLMIGNVAFWRWLVSRFLQRQQISAIAGLRPATYKLIFLGHAKLTILIGLIYLMIRFLPMNSMFFTIGLLVLPLAAFLWASYRTLKALFGQHHVSTTLEGNQL